MTRKQVLVIAALTVLSWSVVVALVAPAFARQCTTTCQTYGNQTTCQQNCW